MSPSLSLVAASMSLSLVVVVPMSPLLHCRRSSSCLPLVVLYVARCSVAVVIVAISPSLVVLLVVASSLPSSPYRHCFRVAASSLSSSLDVFKTTATIASVASLFRRRRGCPRKSHRSVVVVARFSVGIVVVVVVETTTTTLDFLTSRQTSTQMGCDNLTPGKATKQR